MHEEFRRGMGSFYNIMQHWRNTVNDARQEYLKIFTAVKNYDKHIARRSDGLTGAWFADTPEMQLFEGLITIADLNELSNDVREHLLLWLRRRNQPIENPE